jgi:N-methylhydantoinase A
MKGEEIGLPKCVHFHVARSNVSVLNRLFEAMRSEAEAVVRLGAPNDVLVESREAMMRYRGQGHEIAVPLPNGVRRPA